MHRKNLYGTHAFFEYLIFLPTSKPGGKEGGSGQQLFAYDKSRVFFWYRDFFYERLIYFLWVYAEAPKIHRMEIDARHFLASTSFFHQHGALWGVFISVTTLFSHLKWYAEEVQGSPIT